MTEKEKKKILTDLNDKRLSEQKKHEIEVLRTSNKKIYKMMSKECYKFLNMEREYYITIKDAQSISSRAKLITLYYKTFSEFRTKDYLIKTEVYSDKFFISDDPIRVYFKAYSLESDK